MKTFVIAGLALSLIFTTALPSAFAEQPSATGPRLVIKTVPVAGSKRMQRIQEVNRLIQERQDWRREYASFLGREKVEDAGNVTYFKEWLKTYRESLQSDVMALAGRKNSTPEMKALIAEIKDFLQSKNWQTRIAAYSKALGQVYSGRTQTQINLCNSDLKILEDYLKGLTRGSQTGEVPELPSLHDLKAIDHIEFQPLPENPLNKAQEFIRRANELLK